MRLRGAANMLPAQHVLRAAMPLKAPAVEPLLRAVRSATFDERAMPRERCRYAVVDAAGVMPGMLSRAHYFYSLCDAIVGFRYAPPRVMPHYADHIADELRAMPLILLRAIAYCYLRCQRHYYAMILADDFLFAISMSRYCYQPDFDFFTHIVFIVADDVAQNVNITKVSA